MTRNYVPKPKKKMMQCEYCTEMIEVGWKTKKAPKHITCAIQAATDNNVQLARHSGPYYEKWLNAMSRAFSLPGTGTVPSQENVPPSRDS